MTFKTDHKFSITTFAKTILTPLLLSLSLLSGCGSLAKLEPYNATTAHVKLTASFSVPLNQPLVTKKDRVMFTHVESSQIGTSGRFLSLDSPLELIPSVGAYAPAKLRAGEFEIRGYLNGENQRRPAVEIALTHGTRLLLPIQADGTPGSTLFNFVEPGRYIAVMGTWQANPSTTKFKMKSFSNSTEDSFALVYKGLDGAFAIFESQNLTKGSMYGRSTTYRVDAKPGSYNQRAFVLTLLDVSPDQIRFQVKKQLGYSD